MSNYFDKLDRDKSISRSVITSLDTQKLKNAKAFITDLMEFRKVKKLYDTYVTGVSKAMENNGENTIYLEYRLDGTVTGRLSNAGYDAREYGRLGVSFHTLPRETEYNIRSYVIAPKGHKFITADMKGMELRMLAHVAKEERMIKALQDRVDLHTYTAEMVFNKTKDQVTKEERQISKAVSFLTVYGGTEHTLSLKQGISLERASDIIEAWMDTYPGVRRYMTHVRQYMEANGHAYTIFGRKRNLQNINSIIKSVRNGAFRQGLNFTVQSPSSDTIVCGLLGLKKKYKARKMQTKIVGTVHDSVELISPDSEVEEAIKLLHLEMVTYPYIREKFDIKFRVPLELEVIVGDSFGTGEEYHLPFLDNF